MECQTEKTTWVRGKREQNKKNPKQLQNVEPSMTNHQRIMPRYQTQEVQALGIKVHISPSVQLLYIGALVDSLAQANY